jgi:hypothetical protein
MIGRLKMNERLPGMTPKRELLDFSVSSKSFFLKMQRVSNFNWNGKYDDICKAKIQLD